MEQTTGNFTDQVMNQIHVAPSKSAYKPLIGRSGRILIILFFIGIVLLTVFYSEPGGSIFKNVGVLYNMEWNLSQFNFNWDLFSDINLSPWLVSTIIALFLLVLSDTRLNRRSRLT